MPLSSGLSGAQIIDLVDEGAGSGHAGRAELLLVNGVLDGWVEGARTAGLGQRESWLVELRRATFGDDCKGVVRCAACGQRQAVDLDVGRVRFVDFDLELAPVPEVEVAVGDVLVRARVPDGRALAEAARYPEAWGARASLVASCVRSAVRDGVELPVATLPDDVVAAVGEALAEADPQAEVQVALRCTYCEADFTAIFDISRFMWAEVEAASIRLVDEVHALAQGYGWTEPAILALSPHRRRRYMERLADE